MKKCVKSLAMTIVSIIICAVFLTACGIPTISPVVNGGATNGATTTAPEYNDEITSGGISVGETDKFEYTYKTDNYEADIKPNAPQIDFPNNTEIKSNEQLPDKQPILTGEVSDKINTGEVADPVGSTEMETPNEKTSDDETVSATYIASAGGRIIGESEQVLIKNQFTSAVVAEADVGNRFTRWSDGRKDKKRNDKVSKSFIVTAEFQPIDSGIVENDLLFNLLNDGTGYAVEAYNRRLTVATIPSIVNGLPVKEIASRGFDYCMDLKRVSLPETVKVIRENAFEECTNLKIVKGMSGVEEICARAFSGCSQLERIIGICNVKKIRAYAFSKCLELENLILSDTIEYLESGEKAMESLKPVFLRKTKEEFKAVYIEKFPNGDKFRPKAIYIGAEGKPNAEYANKEDDELFSFTPTIDGMGYVVSAKDAKMTEALIPSHYNGIPVTEIAERGFADCNVVTAYIPDSVKKVGNNAFVECRNLIRVAGLNGVSVIGDEAFANCRKLNGIVLPNSLEIAGSYIFRNNPQTIYIRKTQNDANKLNFDWNKGRPDSAKTVCVGETGMPEDIGYGMYFAKCKPHKELFPDIEEFILLLWMDPNLTSAIIPPYVDGLPVKCILEFYCEKLKWVFIPDTVEIMLSLTFYNCKNLERIYGAKNMQTIEIEYDTFKNCDNLRRFILSDGVTFSKDYITTL